MKRGTLRFNPIRLNNELTSSMGQTWHQTRPTREVLIMTRGHHRDQTMRTARLVLPKTPAIFCSTWGATSPPAIKSPNPTKVKI